MTEITARLSTALADRYKTVMQALLLAVVCAACGEQGKTALMTAAENGDTEVVSLLLNNGADVNAQDNDNWGGTALMLAVIGGHADVVNALLENGADVSATLSGGPMSGVSALMMAVVVGHADVAIAIMQGGADVNAQDREGFTAVMYAEQYGRTEVVTALLAKGARLAPR